MMRRMLPTASMPQVVVALSIVVWLAGGSSSLRGQLAADTESAPTSSSKGAAGNSDPDELRASDPARKAPAYKLPEPKGAKRLSREYDVWVDPKAKVVIVDGQVSLREGMLEMFSCTRNTKEHESIVSANTQAYLVHAALLSVGAVPGRPVQFVPKYRPPTGTEIDITLQWRDEKGKEHTAKAQDWIKDINTKKAMTHPFVFAGSAFWTDEASGKKFYQAEGGDFICVSNFGTAMLDIPVKSSQTNTELAFEAFTDRIPPLGAPVRMILKPKLKTGTTAPTAGEKKAAAEKQPAGASAAGSKQSASASDASKSSTSEEGSAK